MSTTQLAAASVNPGTMPTIGDGTGDADLAIDFAHMVAKAFDEEAKHINADVSDTLAELAGDSTDPSKAAKFQVAFNAWTSFLSIQSGVQSGLSKATKDIVQKF